MREFIYFSSKARTSGNFDDLMKAGRMDIVCHFIINSFFLSHKKREDMILHLVFYGAPDPPKHLIIQPEKYLPETGKEVGSLDLSKKDVANFIKKMLYKYRGGKTEVFKGCFVEKKSLFNVVDELQEQGREIYLLDDRGESFDKIELKENSVFLVGDFEGFPKKEFKRLKKSLKTVSLASQVATILNYEMDKREENIKQNLKNSNFLFFK